MDIPSRKSSTDTPTTNNLAKTIDVIVTGCDNLTHPEKKISASEKGDDETMKGNEDEDKSKAKARVTTTSENEDDQSYSQPPPPPRRPHMTTSNSQQPITLPNGVTLPIGTKEIVVHPYHAQSSYCFPASSYQEAFNNLYGNTDSNETEQNVNPPVATENNAFAPPVRPPELNYAAGYSFA